MQDKKYKIQKNIYGDALVPYEIAKVLKNNGFPQDVSYEIYFNGEIKDISLMPSFMLMDESGNNEVICCPTISAAKKWVEKKYRQYLSVEISADECCNPTYAGKIICLPEPDEYDQGCPNEYIMETPNSYWHCHAPNSFGLSMEIVNESEDELYLDFISYMLDID